MESEKVKEIKKALEEGQFNTINHHQKEGKPIKISFADILTLINELEKENANKTDTIVDLLKKQESYEKEKLTKFAERLKEKPHIKKIVNEGWIVSYVEICNDIDETLKEFINKGDEER